MKITENGVNSPSFRNALAYAKRKARKECYSFLEVVEDATIEYSLTTEESNILKEKLVTFCLKNYLYISIEFRYI